MILAFSGIGIQELVVVFLVVLLLFGAKRIPEIARSLGRASREFKKAKDDIVDSAKDLADAAEKKAAEEDEDKDKDTRK